MAQEFRQMSESLTCSDMAIATRRWWLFAVLRLGAARCLLDLSRNRVEAAGLRNPSVPENRSTVVSRTEGRCPNRLIAQDNLIQYVMWKRPAECLPDVKGCCPVPHHYLRAAWRSLERVKGTGGQSPCRCSLAHPVKNAADGQARDHLYGFCNGGDYCVRVHRKRVGFMERNIPAWI